jgi:hypothetical protein
VRFQAEAVLTLALCTALWGQVQAIFSFEENMEGWESDSAMPNPPCFVNSSPVLPCYEQGTPIDRLAGIQCTRDKALDGSYSLRFTADGTAAQGTAWITRPFAVTPRGRYRVRLEYAMSPPNGWGEMAYAGSRRPRGALPPPGPQTGDFRGAGGGSQGPVALPTPGWQRFEYLTLVTTDNDGLIWVALGVNVSHWEVMMSVYVDKVTVTIDPIDERFTTAALGMVQGGPYGQYQSVLRVQRFQGLAGSWRSECFDQRYAEPG